PAIVTAVEQRATTAHHVHAALVDVRPGDAGRASVADLVRAVHTLAAEAGRDEQVVVAVTEHDDGRLDAAAATGDRVQRTRRLHVAAELRELDARIPRAERQPCGAVRIDGEIRIDRVVVVRCGRAD